MKKYIISILLILCMIIALIPSYIKAANKVDIKLSGPTQVKYGKEFELTISINGQSQGIKAVQMTIDYDKDILEYIDNECKKDGWYISGYSDETGIMLAEMNDITDEDSMITNDSKLVVFRFKVKDPVKSGNTKIKISDIIMSSKDSSNSTNTEHSIKIIGNIQEENNGNNGSGSTGNNGPNNPQSGQWTGSTSSGGGTTSQNGGSSTSQGGGATSTGGGSTSNKSGDNNLSDSDIPKTGIESTLLIIVGPVLLLVISYIKYNKYKDIK